MPAPQDVEEGATGTATVDKAWELQEVANASTQLAPTQAPTAEPTANPPVSRTRPSHRREEDVEEPAEKWQRSDGPLPKDEIIEVAEVYKGKSATEKASSASVWALPFLKPDQTPITEAGSLFDSPRNTSKILRLLIKNT